MYRRPHSTTRTEATAAKALACRLRALAGAALLGILMSMAIATPASASTLPLAFGGRLTQGDSSPVKGPVDLEVNFYNAASGGSKLGASPYEFSGINLAQGVFNLTIEIAPASLQTLFPDPAVTTWIEITDKTSGKTYPRQQFTAVPYAIATES